MVNENMKEHMNDSEILNIISQSSEFQNIRVREDEIIELEKLKRTVCEYELKGGVDSQRTKTNILIQVIAFSRQACFLKCFWRGLALDRFTLGERDGNNNHMRRSGGGWITDILFITTATW